MDTILRISHQLAWVSPHGSVIARMGAVHAACLTAGVPLFKHVQHRLGDRLESAVWFNVHKHIRDELESYSRQSTTDRRD